MAEQIIFKTREDFRAWLEVNCLAGEGIWLVFGKVGGPMTLTAQEALEEALCYGWIDGQMKKVDEKSYLKYFAQRRKGSEWSAKNIGLVEKLESMGRMTDHGRIKIEEAKGNNCYVAKKRMEITEEDLNQLVSKISGIEPAFTNFLAMSPSVKRTYAMHYLDAKSETTRASRLQKIIERLNLNLKPM